MLTFGALAWLGVAVLVVGLVLRAWKRRIRAREDAHWDRLMSHGYEPLDLDDDGEPWRTIAINDRGIFVDGVQTHTWDPFGAQHVEIDTGRGVTVDGRRVVSFEDQEPRD